MHHPVQLAIFAAGSLAAGAAALALRRRTARPVAFVLAGACVFVAALFALKILPLLLREEGFLRSDGLYPLWARWETSPAPAWILLALVAGAGLVALLWGLTERAGPGLLVAALALTGTLWIALALSNGHGVSGLTGPFRRDADYQADVPRFASLPEIWRTYVDRQAELSLHGRTHPPGAVTVLWVLDRLLGGSLVATCLAVVLLSAAGLLPVLMLARACLDDAGARVAAVLWTTTPAVALYGATSMDMVFALPLVAAAAAFAWGLRTPPPRRAAGWGVAAGTALALGSLFTFSSAVLAVALLIASALVGRRHPEDRPRLTLLLGATGLTCFALLVSLRAAGFDWLACLDTARRIDAADHPATLSPSYWLLTRLMGVLDVLLLAGPAGAALWLGALRRRAFDRREEVEGAPAVSPRLIGVALGRGTAVAVAAFLLLGIYKIGETGRIFLFLMPLIPILAVARLQRAWPTPRSWVRGAVALAALGLAQAALFEWLLDTRW